MAYGLLKLSNAANRLQAWRDWDELCAEAVAKGHKDLADKYMLPEGVGWRTIDKRIAKLREELKKLEANNG